MELISVIIPVYNVESYLRQCVDSVIAQSYQNLEIILVDDGSTDCSGQLCDAYASEDRRIRVIHKVNGGLSDARNAGIAAATGEYLTFIDSDDYVDSDYVAFLYELVSTNRVKMAICSHTVVYENGTVLHKETGEFACLDRAQVLERILYDEGIDLSAWAKLYHRSLFSQIQFPAGRVFEDAATTYRFVYESETVALGSLSKLSYRIRGNSISNASFSRKKLDLITSTREMADFCVEKYPHLRKAALRRLAYAYLSTLSQLANSEVKDPEVQKELMSFLRRQGPAVLMDPRSKNRDKVGIASALFGFRFYRFIWRCYRRLTGRV